MAAVSLLDENPHPTEADVRLGLEGNLCRCTGYQNIVQGGPGRRGRGGAGMSERPTERADGPLRAAGAGNDDGHRDRPAARVGGPFGQRMLRKEDARLLTGEGRFVDDLQIPGALWMGMVRSPFAHARIGNVDASAALGHARRPPRLHRRRPGGGVGGGDALRLAGHRRHEGGRPLAGGQGQGVLRRRHRRRGGGRDPVPGRRRRRRRGRRLRPARTDRRPRGRGQRPHRHPRRPRHQPQLHVDPVARPRRRRPGVRRGGAHGQRALRAAAADPRGDGDPGRRGGARRLRRRRDRLLGHADPPHPQGDDRRHVRRPRAEAAGRRAVGGRGLRVEARTSTPRS